MPGDSVGPAPVGLRGALAVGIGGIVGGGFFATFGLAVVGARGATFVSFVVGGVLALLTGYAYSRLTLRYPGPGGTAAFIRTAFGSGLLASSLNVLLVLSYVAILAVYANALAAYSVASLPAEQRDLWTHVVASVAIIALAFINFASARLTARAQQLFNAGKLLILAAFIAAGFAIGGMSWDRLSVTEWPPAATIVSSGMVAFLSFEGFELIANLSGNMSRPQRTLPFAYFGSILVALCFYVLIAVVAVGHLPISAMKDAQNFALSAAARSFAGAYGFGLLALGAVIASASAITADFTGASRLPGSMALHGEAPAAFTRQFRGQPIVSTVTIAILALFCVNVLDIHAVSTATSSGFLLVFAGVNLANARLASETGSIAWISWLAVVACVAALLVMGVQVFAEGHMRSAVAIVGIIVLALALQVAFRTFAPRTPAAGSR